MYYLLLYGNQELLNSLLTFFVKDAWEFDASALSFTFYSIPQQGNRETTGHLNHDNFEEFRAALQSILGMKKADEPNLEFKNQAARQIYDKMQSHTLTKEKQQDENYSLDNMIKKYCTHNKVGINILNVWDLTYYQFTSMFTEYCNGRQCDFNDFVAANSFSYKKASDYKPLEFIKRLN